MPEYNPIPIPFKQRWRQFRTQVLPVLVFLVAASSMFWLWGRQAAPGTVMGEVYAPASLVNAPVAGWIEGGPVDLFRQVEAGEVIARVRSVPAEQAALQLAVLREELNLIRRGVGEPVLNQQRNLLSWQGLRRDWMLARSDLAVLEVQIRQAEADAQRIAKLVETRAESISLLEQAQALYDALVAEREEKTRLSATLEDAVSAARIPAENENDAGIGAGITAALDWKEAELRSLEAQLKPIEVLAPFAGRITRVFRHAGDYVNSGETVAELRSTQPEAIIGYMKQPLFVTPKVGMEVEITPRGGARTEVALASILEVGPQFEPMQPVFMRVMPVTMEERGLPLRISLPPRSALIPGQIVDIRLPRATQ
jgi:multidrug resistance efflux pump